MPNARIPPPPGHLQVPELRLPSEMDESPIRQLRGRLLVGLALIMLVSLTTYIERDGYNDSSDGTVDLLDSVYYATVSITTTGYGDVVPVTDAARAVTTFLVTPMRMIFLVLLVGTSVELITAATRRRLRRQNWRKRVRDHVIICGFGVKGRSALQALAEQGQDNEHVVVVDADPRSVDAAARMGYVGVQGDMTSNAVLQQAGVERARAVIIAPTRDDTAVLTTLTVRSLVPEVRIVATAREIENAPLLRHSGADIVLTSSGSTGRMLGIASASPCAVRFIEDLLERGNGFDVTERSVDVEAPLSSFAAAGELVVAVYRNGEVVAHAPKGDHILRAGDRIVALHRA
jgi:voltage-gated potassium channel